jgi:protoheme IX farnesyltransferase
VLMYTTLLALVSLVPFLIRMSGFIYLFAALVLNARFLYYALALNLTGGKKLPMRVFKFSVTYLMWLFAALLIDHYLPTTQIPAA